MKLAAKTDIGYGRLENQDNYRAARLPDDTVWGLICDGMGGANSGKLASQLAAQALEEYFDQGLADLVPGQEIEFLRKAVHLNFPDGIKVTVRCRILIGIDHNPYLICTGQLIQCQNRLLHIIAGIGIGCFALGHSLPPIAVRNLNLQFVDSRRTFSGMLTSDRFVSANAERPIRSSDDDGPKFTADRF